MKRLFAIGLLSTAVAVAAEESKVSSKATEAASSTGGPQITFEEARHDFGTVEPQVLKHAFKFKNTGTALLELKNVQAGCGCTVIPDYEKKIEPGKESVIKAELNIGSMKGHVEKGITVTSNDPKNPSIHLTLAADIKVDLMVLPNQYMMFGKLTPQSQTNYTFEIRSNLAEPLEIKSVETSATNWLSAKLVSSTTNSAKIEIATRPPIPYGQNRSQVTVTTGYEKEQHKKLVINVTAPVLATISVTPSSLMFPASQNKLTQTKALSVRRNDGKDFHIKEINCPTSAITPSITTNKAGQEYRISFNYTPEDSKTPSNGKIEILTDEPAWPKIEVPYAFR